MLVLQHEMIKPVQSQSTHHHHHHHRQTGPSVIGLVHPTMYGCSLMRLISIHSYTDYYSQAPPS